MLRNVAKLLLVTLLVGLLAGAAFARPIRIGTKNFTEQYIAGELMAQLLREHGYNVDLRTGMSSDVLREALVTGDVDICMEYTGTHWLSHTMHLFDGETSEEMFEQVRAYDAELGIVWLDPIWNNNTYALATTQDFVDETGVRTLSDFAEYVTAREGKVPIATTFEFYGRPDGLLGMQLHYGFAFDPQYVTPVLPGLTFEYLLSGRSVITLVFGTDSVVVEHGWVILEDDKNFWPPYDLAPNVRADLLELYPEIADILGELVAAFPDEPAEAQRVMTELNWMVDFGGMEPDEAAREFLIEHGLIEG